MKYQIIGKHGHNMWSGEMMEQLGLRPGAHLPKEGMPAREIQGIQVYVEPAGSNNFKSRRHRVMAICPGCGTHMSAGRLHQHNCKIDRNLVFQSLNNAVENGYDLKSFSPENISRDLADYDSQFENIDPELLVYAITDWHKSFYSGDTHEDTLPAD